MSAYIDMLGDRIEGRSVEVEEWVVERYDDDRNVAVGKYVLAISSEVNVKCVRQRR